jgi:thiol-disulfide isomerase/thioredoxin
MNLYAKFAEALPLADFLARHGTIGDRPRWQAVAEAVSLTDAQTRLLQKFRRETHVLVLAGAWCGDCISQCPIFERFARAAPVIQVRYIDRDVHADAQEELLVNGGRRVPVVVFFSEDGHEVARYGDRTLAKYRTLVEQQTGETCSSGVVGADDPGFAGVVRDWLNEFERVQWILRLSPRLRQRHGD